MAEPDGQFEVVARRPHGGGHQMTVEADLEGFLDDHRLGSPTGVGGTPIGQMPGQHGLRTPTAHGATVPARTDEPAIGPTAAPEPDAAVGAPEGAHRTCSDLSDEPIRSRPYPAWPEPHLRACRR